MEITNEAATPQPWRKGQYSEAEGSACRSSHCFDRSRPTSPLDRQQTQVAIMFSQHTGIWLTNELVLDIAARALGKHCALLPCVWVDHLGGRLTTQVAGELHPLCSARVCCRGPHNIICIILHELAASVSCWPQWSQEGLMPYHHARCHCCIGALLSSW